MGEERSGAGVFCGAEAGGLEVPQCLIELWRRGGNHGLAVVLAEAVGGRLVLGRVLEKVGAGVDVCGYFRLINRQLTYSIAASYDTRCKDMLRGRVPGIPLIALQS